MPAFLLLLESLCLHLLVQAHQLPCELTGLEGEELSPHGTTLTVCLASVSAHSLPRGTKSRSSFRLWPPQGMAGPRAPSLEPRESHRGGLWVYPEQKTASFRDELIIISYGCPPPSQARRCYFCITFSLLVSARRLKPQLFMETVTGCLRYSIY